MKIALCCPCHGDTKAKFTSAITAMAIHTMGSTIIVDGKKVKPELDVFFVSCSMLPESRNRLVVEALAYDAEYMLWLDADHVFPPDALLRLLSRNQLVVGCNYSRRFTPTSPTASRFVGDKMELVYTTKEKYEADELEEVAHLGLGFCLIDMRVFGALEQKAQAEGKEHFWPLFRMDPAGDGIAFTGEDVHFFKMIREAGIPVYVDHQLSWEVGHIDEQILTSAHAVIQKERKEKWDKTRMDKLKEKVAA